MVFLADQCLPAILPTDDASCPAILRVEGGSLNEIGSFFCTTLGELALPPGSIILLGSLTNLMTEGLPMYIERAVNEVQRFNSMFQGTVTVLPFAPPPLCGISDPETIRSLFDLSLWLDSTPILFGQVQHRSKNHVVLTKADRCFLPRQNFPAHLYYRIYKKTF